MLFQFELAAIWDVRVLSMATSGTEITIDVLATPSAFNHSNELCPYISYRKSTGHLRKMRNTADRPSYRNHGDLSVDAYSILPFGKVSDMPEILRAGRRIFRDELDTPHEYRPPFLLMPSNTLLSDERSERRLESCEM
jgi:hypothetical protein